MTYNTTRRLYIIIPRSTRILMQNHSFHLLKNTSLTRAFSSVLPIKNHEDKYTTLSRRLAEVPCISLIEKVADRVHQDLCYEEDEGIEDALNWYSKVIKYNVREEKTYPTVLLKTFCTYGFSMDDPSWNQWDSEAWRSAAILAWCVKLIITYFNMMDDIMDDTMLRNGKPCWHKNTDVMLGAVNDCVLLQAGIYKLLQKHFGNSKCYLSLLHEFLKATRETAYGQCMNERCNFRKRKQDSGKLTFKLYQTQTKYKSAPLAFHLPVFLAMHLAGGCTEKDYDFAKKLCLKLGMYIQNQDDYYDCFGTKEVERSGMMGNDIREGTRTWLSAKFFEEASEPMKKQFLENFGVDDKDAIANVLELYKKAKIPEKLEEFNKQLYAEISTLIESMNDAKGYLFYELFVEAQNRER